MAQNAPPHITDRTQGHLPGFEMPVFQFLRLKQTKTRFLCKTKKPRYSVESMQLNIKGHTVAVWGDMGAPEG